MDTPLPVPVSPPPEYVREQLKRILKSEAFHNDRHQRILCLLVEETLEGRYEHLKGAAVASQFGLTFESFRTEVMRLRTALDLYYYKEGAGDQIRISLPRGHYVPAFSLTKLPPPLPPVGDHTVLLERARLAAVFGIAVHPMFGAADWLNFHDAVPVVLRLSAALGSGLIYWLSRTPLGSKHIFPLILTGFIVATISEALVIWHKDLYLRGYSAGFFIIMLAFCVLIPATMRQTAAVCAVFVAACFGPVLLRYNGRPPLEFLNWAIGFGCATAIILVGRRQTDRQRGREMAAVLSMRSTIP